MIKIKPSKKLYLGTLAFLLVVGLVVVKSGVLTKHMTNSTPKTVAVKAMQVTTQNTPINYEFVGKVASKNEIKLYAKTSGNIVEKLVNGGDSISKGQPLFRVDNKQYHSAINSAAATLTKSQATLHHSQRDLERYRQLAEANAVAAQTVDNYEAQVEEDAATVATNQANLEEARQNEQDTLIVSPVNGRIDLNDLNVGDFVTAGSTVLGTLSSLDPIWVQFSISETEYIKYAKSSGGLPENFRNNLRLILSDGSEYPLLGKVEELDKGISSNTGTITIKASFSNPQHFLVPGMFAKIRVVGEVVPNAILVPQRAVKQLLDNSFIYVIHEDNTVESRQVTLGDTVGNMVIVTEGINPNDIIIVEGIDKVKQGSQVQATLLGSDEVTTLAAK